MSVRILTARPHRLFASIVKEIGLRERRSERALLLVPEQFTLAAERELMDRLHLQGMFLIDVLSPSRLYDRVLASAGRDGREPLGDAGQRMAISQAVEKLDGKLPYYGSIIHRRGFVEKLSALLTDMKRGGMTPEALEEYAIALEAGPQKDKLGDLGRIYAQYRDVLSDRFSDSDDQLAYVAGRLAQSGCLQGQHLYVYGFDTLPQQMMQLLRSAAPLCESMTIGLLCDALNAPDGELFTPIRQGIQRFSAMLRQDGIDVHVEALPKQPLRHAPAIDHLDDRLFVYPPKPFEGEQHSVYISSALSAYEEAALMSREVLWLLEGGMDIERIAVLYPDSGDYDFAVSAALGDSGLPFYTDRQLPAASHGLVRFLLSALHAMADGWRNRDILGMLKSGYAPLSFEEACELENYAICCGIDRMRWLSPFTRGSQEQIDRCEPLRQKLMEPLIKARKGLIDARDAVSSLTAVFELLTDIDAYEMLKQEEEKLLQRGFTVRANQNSQIWQAVLSLLDQLARLGGSSRIPLKHIATRMECGFSAISLSSLPPGSGMLHAGALGHLLAEDVDAVFLLGMNDGLLTKETDSLLTPEERQRTQDDTGCFLGITDESRTLLAKWDLKRAMTLAKKHLFLSCARTAPDGAALRPLSLLATIQTALLPQTPAVPSDELPMSAHQALGELGIHLRSQLDGAAGLDDAWQKRLQTLLRSPSTAPEAMRLLRALHFDGSAQPLTPPQARALFGDETLSVSRLEQFADCPFKHFVTYGLRPHVLKEWKIDPIETGSFYHDSLNNFARIAKCNKAFPHVSEEQVTAMAAEAMQPLMNDVLSGPMGDGDRSMARFDAACSAIQTAAHTITRQLAAGRFSLYRTEASFGYEGGMPPIVLVLSDGREVALRGRIDRIDRYDSPDSVYLRVIDYKSSQRSLEAARTWWGLQLQLLLYLDVCTNAIPGAKPAGAFYFYVADPLVESDTDVAQTVQNKLRDVFHLRGIALSDVEVVTAMDEGETPCVLPPMYLKSGEVKKAAYALDLAQLTALMRHARDTAAQLAGSIFDGVTDISPVRESNRVSCDMCELRTVCRFDSSQPDAPVRQLPAMDMEGLREVLEQVIKKEPV